MDRKNSNNTRNKRKEYIEAENEAAIKANKFSMTWKTDLCIFKLQCHDNIWRKLQIILMKCDNKVKKKLIKMEKKIKKRSKELRNALYTILDMLKSRNKKERKQQQIQK
ncbi:hypothetical protein RFI_01023 [Reticulomyxa filosa]|uniref:Uncharacterized protein n=1 Tax=Reticulomyxa filosa TaxID=46433 RepID=X6PEB9_RETFI|nr:hypothetical protein RFI_01023 [Reticulomyxa filosa]|eukprot:ETO36037.1 hypothetical protein RFI_01023 [Reticulomyxa filosa]